MHTLAALLFAVSSVSAYLVTNPTDTSGWTVYGPNVLSWTRVDTDPTTFATVLVNQATGYSEILDCDVDGTTPGFSIVSSTPYGGWPTGPHFRVNLAQDCDHPESLLAQSSEFDITD